MAVERININQTHNIQYYNHNIEELEKIENEILRRKEFFLQSKKKLKRVIKRRASIEKEIENLENKVFELEKEKKCILEEYLRLNHPINTGLNNPLNRGVTFFRGGGIGAELLSMDAETGNHFYKENQRKIKEVNDSIDFINIEIKNLKKLLPKLIEDQNDLTKKNLTEEKDIEKLSEKKDELIRIEQDTEEYERDFPYHKAARKGIVEKFENISDEDFELMSCPDNSGNLPVIYACEEGKLSIIEKLIEFAEIPKKQLKRLMIQSEYHIEKSDGEQKKKENYRKIFALINPATRYDHLWNAKQRLNEKISIVFEDYYAPIRVQTFYFEKLRRILTGHFNRHYFKEARALAVNFNDNKKIRSYDSILEQIESKCCSDENELSVTQNLKKYINNLRKGSFFYRLNYVLIKLKSIDIGNEKCQDKKSESLIISSNNQMNCIKGLEYEKVPSDGNCLFHAIALYLSQDQQFLRNVIAANLDANWHLYRSSIDLRQGQTKENFLAEIRSPAEWGGNLEIAVLMQLLDRPIVVINQKGAVCNRVELQDENEELRFAGDPIFIYYNGRNHYDALLLKENFSARDILYRLINRNYDTSEESSGESSDELFANRANRRMF